MISCRGRPGRPAEARDMRFLDFTCPCCPTTPPPRTTGRPDGYSAPRCPSSGASPASRGCRAGTDTASSPADGNDGEPARAAAWQLQARNGLTSPGPGHRSRPTHTASPAPAGNHVLHRTVALPRQRVGQPSTTPVARRAQGHRVNIPKARAINGSADERPSLDLQDRFCHKPRCLRERFRHGRKPPFV